MVSEKVTALPRKRVKNTPKNNYIGVHANNNYAPRLRLLEM